jgi:phage recombination protein Bet
MTSTDVAVASGGTLALAGDQVDWTPVQRAALAHLGIDKAPAPDQKVFLHVAQRVGLDPFAKQIWMIPRGGKWTIQTAIDGFRLIADRRPDYAGQVGPQWCGDDGVWREFWASKTPPVAARVGVLRRDWAEPVWGVAMFAEFTANNQMWREKGAHQLAKCAEALAIRKAFPQELSGLYTDDELHAGTRAAGRVQAAAAPVTAAELTGAPVTPSAQGATDRMSTQQQGLLFKLLAEAEIEDRKEWASGILGREISSYGQLGQGDAATLIDHLQEGLAALAGEGADR